MKEKRFAFVFSSRVSETFHSKVTGDPSFTSCGDLMLHDKQSVKESNIPKHKFRQARNSWRCDVVFNDRIYTRDGLSAYDERDGAFMGTYTKHGP